jgi:hypothetical protein
MKLTQMGLTGIIIEVEDLTRYPPIPTVIFGRIVIVPAYMLPLMAVCR